MWILLLLWDQLLISWSVHHALLQGIVLEGKGLGIQMLNPAHLQAQLVVWECIGGEVAGYPENCLIARFCLAPWLPRLLDKVCRFSLSCIIDGGCVRSVSFLSFYDYFEFIWKFEIMQLGV